MVSDKMKGVLVVPTTRLANVTLGGEIVTGQDPVPLRLTVCGLFAAASVNVSAPVRVPAAVGEKVTPILQLAPAATLPPQVLLAMAKSPVVAILVKVRAVFSLLVKVTDFAGLVLPA